jgi:hypothetical protein
MKMNYFWTRETIDLTIGSREDKKKRLKYLQLIF